MTVAHSCWSWGGMLLLALWAATAGATDADHPLEPPDLSSPRATLNTFLALGDRHSKLLREEYWDTPSRAAVDRLGKTLTEMERLLDLSEIPPAARFDFSREAVHYLYEVLSRVELPPQEDIPDATAYAASGEATAESRKAEKWTIPHTEITLTRAADGPRAGQFLFDGSTVTRAREFYEKTRNLPYQREVPLPNYAAMRPYLSMSGWVFSARTIEGFPDWLKRSFYGQAVWKWIALALLISVATVAIVLVHRLVGQRLHGRSVEANLRRLLTPTSLLLMPVVLNVANRELTLTSWVTAGVTVVAEGVTYFALGWIVWTGSLAVAEAVIASPKIKDKSLNAQLVRLATRTLGIAGIITIVFYISNRLGAPLYGLVAGLGVGGLALALAVRPTLENIIGGLILFADKPVRIDDFCRFGDDEGTVEEIGLRSTRLRRLDDTLVSVPNSDFSQLQLRNYSRRRRILYQTTLGLRYETTAEQLRYVLTRLREMLIGHPKVSPDSLRVRLHGLGAYSFDIQVFAYIRTREWHTYLAIREDINLRIIDIVKEAGTGLAFPSQTAYLGRDTGLNAELGQEAETQVQAWRSEGQLPFPDFDEVRVSEKEDTLAYPPEGSPYYKPREGPSDATPEPPTAGHDKPKRTRRIFDLRGKRR